MSTYRVFFRNGPGIVGMHEIDAANDEAAVTTAGVLCDACSDHCDAFEIWKSDDCIVGCKRPSPSSVDVIMERRQQAIIRHEEAIQRGKWAIARSKKLMSRLDELRACGFVR